jgi:hypothetical protein
MADKKGTEDEGAFNYKGTNEPWKKPGQASQDPNTPEPAKPDLEKWQDTKTH